MPSIDAPSTPQRSPAECRDRLLLSAAPRRFPNMTPRLGALLGLLLGETYTEVTYQELAATSDGHLSAFTSDGTSAYCGLRAELVSNLQALADSTQGSSHEIDDADLAYLLHRVPMPGTSTV